MVLFKKELYVSLGNRLYIFLQFFNEWIVCFQHVINLYKDVLTCVFNSQICFSFQFIRQKKFDDEHAIVYYLFGRYFIRKLRTIDMSHYPVFD